MENFDNLPVEEKIKRINEFAEKFSEALKPIIERFIKAFHAFSKANALAADSVFTDDFKRKYMAEIKKERHRRRYNRMMARRNN